MATHQEDDKDKVRDVQHQEVVLNNEAPLDAPTHYPAVEFTIEESRKVLRKLDLHVCIPMLIIYMLSHLDKNALSYGAVFDLKTDFHLKGDQYSWLGSIIYLVQLVVQPFSAYALVKLPIAKFVCANVFIWGVAVMCMAACRSWAALMVTRAIVGACEAPISPAFIALVQSFFIRREQSYRNIFWLLSSPIAGLFGSVLAYGVGHIQHGITPYQSIFLFLGGISVVLAPILAWIMPDDIKSARFLDLHEKSIAVERLRSNNTGAATTEWKWKQVREVFTDPKTYIWGVMLFVTAIPSSGWGIFGTLLTQGFGFSQLQSIAFQIPIAFIEGVVMLVAAYATNKLKNRWLPLIVVTLVVMAGGIALATMPRTNLAALLAAYYFLKLYSAIQPLLYSWANQNAAGITKMRVLGGVLFVFQCAGNVVGPQVYLDDEAPIYKTGVTVDIVCWAVLIILAGVMALYLKHLNKRQAKKREAAGQTVNVLDTSIMTLEEAEAYNKTLQAGNVDLVVNTRAFEDLTDFENPEFQYVY